MKKIFYSFLLMLVIVPTLAYAKTYTSINDGDIIKSGDNVKSVKGLTYNYYYGTIDSDGVAQVYDNGVNYYINYYFGSLDENGNFVYDEEPYDYGWHWSGLNYNYFISPPTNDNDEDLTWQVKLDDRNSEMLKKSTNWYNKYTSESGTSEIEFYDIGLYDNAPAINVYQVYDDETAFTINCDNTTNIDFGAKVTCKVNLKSNYAMYQTSFKLLSDKYKISNVKTNNFFWNITDNNDGTYDILFDTNLTSYVQEYNDNQDDYDDFEDFMKEKYNVDVSDIDITDYDDFSDGEDVVTFDITYDNTDNLEYVSDAVKLDNLKHYNTFGIKNDDVVSQDISYGKVVETVVENPKTGIIKYDYLIIPIVITLIILIKNKKKLTIFKNR